LVPKPAKPPVRRSSRFTQTKSSKGDTVFNTNLRSFVYPSTEPEPSTSSDINQPINQNPPIFPSSSLITDSPLTSLTSDTSTDTQPLTLPSTMTSTTHPISATTKSILDMPLPGTKRAPKKFKGDYRYIKDFLNHYEKLLNDCNVTRDDEKCAAILQYCSFDVRETIEGLAEYQTPDWTQLKTALLRLYDSERNELRFIEDDIIMFTKISKQKRIKSMNDFRNYERKFQRVAGWLKGKGELNDDQVNKYFWTGLHKKFRKYVEAQMATTTSTPLDSSKPFPITSIVRAAEAILFRGRFDRDKSDHKKKVNWAEIPSDSDSDTESDTDTGTDSDVDSDDEDNKYYQFKRRSGSKRRMKDRKTIHGDKAKKILKNLDKEETESRKQDQMDTLIRQMQHMSVDDPRYGLLYYRAITLDSVAEKCISPPQFPRQPMARNVDPFQRSLNTSSFQGSQTPTSRTSFECYGCGAKDHGMSNCPSLDNLLKQGMIKRGSDNKLVMKDGSRIFKESGETFVQAAQRQSKATQQTSNYIDFDPINASSKSRINKTSHTYAVQKPPKVMRPTHVEKFDGVFPPPLVHSKPKSRQDRQSTNVQNSSTPIRIRQEQLPEVTPVDVHENVQTFDPDNDDAIIEDISATKIKAQRKPRAPHSSAISQKIDPKDILKRIWNAPFTITVQEIMGVSKDVSRLMNEEIKYKKTPTEEEANHVTNGMAQYIDKSSPPTQGILIKIQMSINGRPVTAIIDTGSTLNIMRDRFADSLRLPINRSYTPVMKDANGGGRNMTGLARNVVLMCGAVATKADLYVADHVPFDLLLGRPWQRENFVSIDERTAGTYIIFKDPDDPDEYYELLGVPHWRDTQPNHDSFIQIADDALPSEHDIFLANGQSQDKDSTDNLIKQEYVMISPFSMDPHEEDSLCEARSCQGSVEGQRPIAQYYHEVLFPDAYDAEDTIFYNVCKKCHVGCKRNSQGGKLITSGKLQTKQDQNKTSSLACYATKIEPEINDLLDKTLQNNLAINTLEKRLFFENLAFEMDPEYFASHQYNGSRGIHESRPCYVDDEHTQSLFDYVYPDNIWHNMDKQIKLEQTTIGLAHNINELAQIDDKQIQDNNMQERMDHTTSKETEMIQNASNLALIGHCTKKQCYNHSEPANADELALPGHDLDDMATSNHNYDIKESYNSDAGVIKSCNHHQNSQELYGNCQNITEPSNHHQNMQDAGYNQDNNMATITYYQHIMIIIKQCQDMTATCINLLKDDQNANDVLEHVRKDTATLLGYKTGPDFRVLPQNSASDIMANTPQYSDNLSSFNQWLTIHGFPSPHESLTPYPLAPFPAPDLATPQSMFLPIENSGELFTDSIIQMNQGEQDGRKFRDFIFLNAKLVVGWSDGEVPCATFTGSAVMRMYEKPLFMIAPLSPDDPRFHPKLKTHGVGQIPLHISKDHYLSILTKSPQYAQKALVPCQAVPGCPPIYMPQEPPPLYTTINPKVLNPLDSQPVHHPDLATAITSAAMANGITKWPTIKLKRKRRTKRKIDKELYGTSGTSDNDDIEDMSENILIDEQSFLDNPFSMVN